LPWWSLATEVPENDGTVIWGNSVTRDNYRHPAMKILKIRQNSVFIDIAVEQKQKGHELFF